MSVLAKPVSFIRRSWLAVTSFSFLLLLLAFSWWSVPLSDFDFWWHIKTGQYILENRGLPDKDPFTFTSIENEQEAPDRPPVILKSYWLSQILLYLVYAYTGAAGTIIFKALVLFLILLALWSYLNRRGASQVVSFFMLVVLVFFIRDYLGARPQIFSFLFAALCFVSLEASRTENKGHWSLPLLMLVWANMHGGFMVGICFILIYAIGVMLGKRPWKEKYPVLLNYSISILLTLANPVTYHTLAMFIAAQDSLVLNETLEFQSPITYFNYVSWNWYPLFVFVAGGLVLVMTDIVTRIKRKSGILPVEHSLLLIGTSAAALLSMRYGIFFMIIAVPVAALWLSSRISLTAGLYVRTALLMAVVLLSCFSPLAAAVKTGVLVDESVIPVRGVEFIRKNSLPSNIYNDISSGGYMAWRLYPEYKTFVDTRVLNPDIYRQYMSILYGNMNSFFGIPEWKALLDNYRIKTIVHGTVNPFTGEIYPLMQILVKDAAWHLVYFDGQIAILTKELPAELPEIPRNMLFQEMRSEIMRGLGRFPGHPGFNRSLIILKAMEAGA